MTYDGHARLYQVTIFNFSIIRAFIFRVFSSPIKSERQFGRDCCTVRFTLNRDKIANLSRVSSCRCYDEAEQ